MPTTMVVGVHVPKRGTRKEDKNMARRRVVSRTIATSIVTAMVCKVSTAEVLTKEFTLSLRLTSDDALKAAKKAYETDDEKIVSVTNVTYNEQLYAMDEIEFLKYAKPVNKDEVEGVQEETPEKPKKRNAKK